jgi:hypothetical protein
LFDFDTEEDSISLIQGLLLLSFWHDSADSPTNCWHWVTVSLNWAMRTGLFNEQIEDTLDPSARAVRRRTWWGLYVRDRLTALWMQQPPRINDGSFNIPLLTPADFDDPIVSDSLTSFLPSSYFLSNPHDQGKLCSVFINLTSVCVLIGGVLSVKLSKRNATLSHQSLSPIRICEGDLDLWFHNHYIDYSTPVPRSPNKLVRLHHSVVRMLYFAALLNVYLSENMFEKSLDQQHSLSKASYAANQVNRTMIELHRQALIQYLPITAVTILVPTLAVYTLEIHSPNLEIRSSGCSHINQCLRFLGDISEVHAAASFGNILLEAATISNTAKLPLQAFQRNSRESSLYDEGQSASYTEKDVLTDATNNVAVVELAETVSDKKITDFIDPNQLLYHLSAY